MTQEDFKKNIVDERIEKMKTSLIAKNKEYANTLDVFAAFQRGTKMSLHSTQEAVAWEFLVKHLQSIQQIVENYETRKKLPDVLTVDEKFGDAINYLILIEGMLKERINNSYNADYNKVKYNYISR